MESANWSPWQPLSIYPAHEGEGVDLVGVENLKWHIQTSQQIYLHISVLIVILIIIIIVAIIHSQKIGETGRDSKQER